MMKRIRFRLKLDRENNRMVILGPDNDEGSIPLNRLDTIDMIEIISDSPNTKFAFQLCSPSIVPPVPLDDTTIEAWILQDDWGLIDLAKDNVVSYLDDGTMVLTPKRD